MLNWGSRLSTIVSLCSCESRLKVGTSSGVCFNAYETAKKAGRTNFNEMLKFLKKNKNIRSILVEKTDRIYRNFKDYVILDEFQGLEMHLVKESTVLTENSKSHEKLVHGFKVLMAKNYLDNLSEEIRKGNQEAVSQGYWLSRIHYGYKRTNDSKKLKINTETAPFIIRAFNLYAEGNLSLDALRNRLYDEGFIYKSNSPKVLKGTLEKMLKNPIYMGNFLYKGTLYKGNHEPLIDAELFDKVQKAFKKDCKPDRRKQHYFLFSGMLICKKCGSVITAEIKKGKYIYYRCANKTGGCGNKSIYVKQEILEKQFEEGLKSVQVTPEHKIAITNALKESFVDEQAYHKEQIGLLNTNCEKLRNRISQLYNDKLDGLITVDLWQEKNNEWVLEHARLTDLIEKHMNANKSYMEQGNAILELLENLYSKYIEQNEAEKRNLIKIVSSNFLLDGENLSYEYKKPFNLFAEGLSCQLKWRIGDSNS